MTLAISVLEDDQALAAMSDPRFLAEWETLYSTCPWATECQSVTFLTTWYHVFRDWYAPLCIAGRGPDGSLLGLMWLAKDRREQRTVCGGSGQAEYHGWLARPDSHARFADEALAHYFQRPRATALTFNLVLEGMPLEWTREGVWAGHMLHQPENRPLVQIPATFAGKSSRRDRRKLNLLKKQGTVDLVRMRNAAQLSAYWPAIAEQYDKRIANVTGRNSFVRNPVFGAFFLECMDRQPGLIEGFALTLDGAVLASMIAQRCRESLVMMVLTFDQRFATSSPARLLIWLAAEAIGEDGYKYLDLSPYGEWKHEMADASAPVTTFTVFPTRAAALLAQGKRATKRLVKQGLDAIGVDYRQLVQDGLRRRRASQAVSAPPE